MPIEHSNPTSNINNSFYGFIRYLAGQKKRLITNIIIICFVSLAIALTLPLKYKSTFSFIPPSGSTGLAAGLLGDMQIGNLTDANNPSPQQILFIIKSYSLCEKIVRQFDLTKRYKTNKLKDPIASAIKILRKNILIEETSVGGLGYEEIIGIDVSIVDQSPDTAFLMATYFHKEMENKFVGVFSRKAASDMAFYGKIISENKILLTAAQDSFIAFQHRYGIYAPSEQVEASIKLFAEIASQIEARNVELKMQAMDLGSNSREVIKLRNEIQTLKEELHRLSADTNNQFFVSLIKIPEQGLEFFNRKRDLEVMEKTYLLLYQQYKQAELQSKKDIPILRMVDYPEVPEYKFKPKRLLIIILIVICETAMFMSFLVLLYIWKQHKATNSNFKQVIDAWFSKS